MTYWLPDGRRLVLLYHSPAEWVEHVRAQLRRVGCSEDYADRVAAGIAAAVVPEAAP